MKMKKLKLRAKVEQVITVRANRATKMKAKAVNLIMKRLCTLFMCLNKDFQKSNPLEVRLLWSVLEIWKNYILRISEIAVSNVTEKKDQNVFMPYKSKE